MSSRATRECDEDEYVSLEGKQSLMAEIGFDREGKSDMGEKYIHSGFTMKCTSIVVHSLAYYFE